MKINEIIEQLKECRSESNYGDGDEYGVFMCCQNADYNGHKKDCPRAAAIDEAIKLLNDMDIAIKDATAMRKYRKTVKEYFECVDEKRRSKK